MLQQSFVPRGRGGPRRAAGALRNRLRRPGRASAIPVVRNNCLRRLKFIHVTGYAALRYLADFKASWSFGAGQGLEFFYFVAEFESHCVSYLPVKAGVRFSM